MQIVEVDIARLVPYANNARIHSPAQIEQVARSIVEFGWTMPVLIDSDGNIFAGHGRVLAAQSLYAQGLSLSYPPGVDGERLLITHGCVPSVDASGWEDGQRRAYILTDNKIPLNSGWDLGIVATELAGLRDLDIALDLTGFCAKEIDQLIDFDLGTTPKPKARNQQKNTIICPKCGFQHEL